MLEIPMARGYQIRVGLGKLKLMDGHSTSLFVSFEGVDKLKFRAVHPEYEIS